MTGRILGIDLGEKRIGLALSDPEGIIASPLGRIDFQSEGHLLQELEKLVKAKGIKEIVVGYPIRTSGKKGKPAEQAEAFARALEAQLNIPVHLFDERMSTAMAEKALLEGDLSRRKRREKIDQVSAALILQSYLEFQRSKF